MFATKKLLKSIILQSKPYSMEHTLFSSHFIPFFRKNSMQSS